jgi:hypothetical protein
MYLSTSDVENMFEQLSRTTAERLRVVFTFMTRWPDGSSGFRPRSWLVERWMAWRGEPFNWAIEPGRVRDMLAARGFDLTEMAQTGVIEGENLVLCERRWPRDDGFASSRHRGPSWELSTRCMVRS